MGQTVAGLAAALGLEYRGDPDWAAAPVQGVNTLEKAGPEEISFLANKKYASQLENCQAAAVIVHEQFAPCTARALVSANPYLDFARLAQLFDVPQGCIQGVHELAFVHPDAQVAENCDVYPFAFIGQGAVAGAGTRIFPGCYVGENCRLGKNCVLYPNVVLMAGVTLGDNVIVHAGVVLGSDGFGFAPSANGLKKIPQIGRVEIGSNVEIGANTAVDRAALDVTRIGDGTKIDNLVQIGHNVTIGEHSILVAQTGISGSTTIGRGVTIAGQAGVSGHLHIGDGATLGPRTGVAKDIPAGGQWGGVPAMERGTFLRVLSATPKIPDMLKRIKALEKEVALLRRQGEEDV